LETHADIAKSLDDKAAQGMFYAWLGLVLYFRSRTKESYQYLLKALEIGQAENDPKISGYARAWLAQPCAEMGRFEEAVQHGQLAYEIGKKLPEHPYLYFKSLWGLSYTNYCQGSGKICFELGQNLIDFGTRHSNMRCLVVGHICVGLGFTSAGDYPAAIRSFEQGVAAAADPFYEQWAKLFLAANYLSNNQLNEAETAFIEVQKYAAEFGCELFADYATALLGIVDFIRGNLSGGIKIVEETMHRMAEAERKTMIAYWENILGNLYLQIILSDEKPNMAFLFKNIGFIVSKLPRADQKAAAHFNNAIELAKKIGAVGTVGKAILNLGLLHKAKKRESTAKDCLTEAIRIFEETEAEGFLNQAREELQSLK
jgi:tetratricopeptide (TPR) repeat protein